MGKWLNSVWGLRYLWIDQVERVVWTRGGDDGFQGHQGIGVVEVREHRKLPK